MRPDRHRPSPPIDLAFHSALQHRCIDECTGGIHMNIVLAAGIIAECFKPPSIGSLMI